MEKVENNSKWNKYLYPNSDILINNYNITNNDELQKKEAEVTFEKLVELYTDPIIGNFDVEHLRIIHKKLFEDIYPWAGNFREVNIAKNNSSFCDYTQIEDSLEYELSLMNKEISIVSNKEELANLLAEYYVVLLDIHPFREGNGRTIREFLREFVIAKTANYEIDWNLIDQKNINEAIANAKFFRGPIVIEFYKALNKREKVNNYAK